MRRIKSIQEFKDIEFTVLKYVNEISKKHGIKCYLAGGTLLGAIRHKGFIPWDDDVDLMLPRKDYDKLIKAINEEQSSPYKVLTYKTDSQYYYPFAKVIDTRTKLVEHVKLPIENSGLGVDLFPIDGVPDTAEKTAKYFRTVGKIREVFHSLYEIGDVKKSNKVVIYINREFLRVLSRILDRLALAHPFDQSKNVSVSVWGYGAREVIAKSKIMKGTEVEFEKEIFMAPIGYETYLKNLYGDYMKLPPKSKQHPEHNASAWYKK